jgi:hypothetical protein
MRHSNSRDHHSISKLLLLRGIAVAMCVSIIFCFIYYRIPLRSLDGIMLVIVALLLLAVFWWRKLGTSPAYGGFLIWFSALLLFVRSWHKHGPDLVYGVGLIILTGLVLTPIFRRRIAGRPNSA